MAVSTVARRAECHGPGIDPISRQLDQRLAEGGSPSLSDAAMEILPMSPLTPRELGCGALHKRFEAEIERDTNKEVREMVITWEDALADSEARGIQLGLEQGIHQGEAVVLKRLLKRRYGELPEVFEERLARASREELESWADRVLDAKRLEDVFGSE